jgi:hypothetical protein
MSAPTQPPRQPSALELANQWAQLPPEHLAAAVKALGPQLRREHELRQEELRQIATQEHHSYVLYVMGMAAGFLIAITSLAAAIILGGRNPTLAGILAGPGLASVITTFVLRRSERMDTHRQPVTGESLAVPELPPKSLPSEP